MKRKHLVLVGLLVVAGVAIGVGAVATQKMTEDEVKVSIDAVPPAVKATILAQANGNPIEEIEMETQKGWPVYEAEVIIDGRETDIRVDPDGNLLGKEVGDKDGDEEVDDDADDVQVSLAELPAAVRDTLVKEAANAQIKEIEKETEDGQVIYSADVIIDGQAFDVKIAPDGTFLGKEADDEDED